MSFESLDSRTEFALHHQYTKATVMRHKLAAIDAMNDANVVGLKPAEKAVIREIAVVQAKVDDINTRRLGL